MMTYLLIDDEPLIRKGTIKKIEKEELPVTCSFEASNGKEGIDFLAHTLVDFIITDMDMPELDGVELLKKIEQRYPQIPVIVISGYQNFTYIQQAVKSQAIDYILKPFGRKEIAASIQKIINLYSEREKKLQMSNELIFGMITGQFSAQANQQLTSTLSPFREIFLVMTFQSKKDDNDLKVFHENSILIVSHPLKSNVSFFFIDKRGLENLEKEIWNCTYFTYQKCKKDFTNIESIYKNLIETMNCLSINDPFGKIDIDDKKMVIPPAFNINQLLFLIESSSTELLLSKLQEVFHAQINAGCSIGTIKETGILIASKTKKMINQYYGSNSNYTLIDIKETIYNQEFDFGAITDFFCDFFTNISKSMKYEGVYASEDLVTNVQKYISLHFKEEISLEFLSEIFYINSSYLSSLFKEKTGQKYIDFLNELRIEKAKELLSSGNKPIKQIARHVGYDNEKYFFRVFKKFTNYSPEQFRLKNKN